MRRRAVTSILVLLLLALVPGSAFADGGAGDQQYQDPFAAPSAPKTPQKKPATTPASSTTPAASTAPASSAPAAAADRQLPRTGAPTDLVGVAGLVLLGSGLVLRRRAASQ
jgi:LPXTG-motif cell wall-anchored protein